MEKVFFQNTQQPMEGIELGQGRQNRQDCFSDHLLSIGIIHDLKNLCSIILGNIELLLMDTSTQDKNYKKLNKIKLTAYKTIDLCGLFMAEQTNYVSADSIISINDLINEAICLRLNNSTHVIYKVNEGSWSILAERKEIIILLKNIIHNAEQAMPAGGFIYITAENFSSMEESGTGKENYVKISIKDNGCGIPQNHLDKIFLRGFTTKKNGTGLGLALCKYIIEKYKGSIQVESAFGKGTVFSVFLPAVNSHDG